jgi:hypothetical protein
MGFKAAVLIESLDHHTSTLWNFLDEVPMSFCGIFLRAVELFSEKNFPKKTFFHRFAHCFEFLQAFLSAWAAACHSTGTATILVPAGFTYLLASPTDFSGAGCSATLILEVRKKSSWSPRTLG